MPNGIKAVSTVASLDFLSLFAQPGQVCPDGQGCVTIMLLNCGDSEITLPRCTIIGFIEKLNDLQFENISQVKEQNWKERTNPIPTPMTE